MGGGRFLEHPNKSTHRRTTATTTTGRCGGMLLVLMVVMVTGMLGVWGGNVGGGAGASVGGNGGGDGAGGDGVVLLYTTPNCKADQCKSSNWGCNLHTANCSTALRLQSLSMQTKHTDNCKLQKGNCTQCAAEVQNQRLQAKQQGCNLQQQAAQSALSTGKPADAR